MNSTFNESKISESLILFKHDFYVMDIHHIAQDTPRKKRTALVTLLGSNTHFLDKMDICKSYYFLHYPFQQPSLPECLFLIIYKCLKKKLEVHQMNIIIALCRGVIIKNMASVIGVSQPTLNRAMGILRRKLGVKPYKAIPLSYFQ